MYTKIASALLISAVLMTPIGALAAGGNITPKFCVAGDNLILTGTLDLQTGERATEIWAFIYQPSTGARQISYNRDLRLANGGYIEGPQNGYSWTAGLRENKQEHWGVGKAVAWAALVFVNTSDTTTKYYYEWSREIDLVTSGAPCS